MESRVDAATATEQLFSLYMGEVYRYARFTTGDPIAAEDIVQNVFLRVLRSWDRYRGDASPKTWLWTVVRSCIIDYQRKHKRSRVEQAFSERIADSVWLDEVQLEAEELLSALSQEFREVVVLRIIQDWSTSDTAKILGWSQSKVKTTLHRALAKLRQSAGEMDEYKY